MCTSLDCDFLLWLMVSWAFSHVSCPSYILFCGVSKVFAPVFYWIVCLIATSFESSLYSLHIVLFHICVCKYFISVYILTFILTISLEKQKILILKKSSKSILHLIDSAFGEVYKKYLSISKSRGFFSYVFSSKFYSFRFYSEDHGPFWLNFCICCEGKDYFRAYGHEIVPVPLVPLNFHCTFVENNWSYVGIYSFFKI